LRGIVQTHAHYSPPVGWRFQRRKKLFPGLTLNLGKRGAGLSVGRRGTRVSTSRRGLTATVGLVGTGLDYVWRRNRQRGRS
jgi:hypothetical protein